MQFRFVGFSSWEDVINMNPIDLENKLNSIENDFDLKILVKNIKSNIKIDNFN